VRGRRWGGRARRGIDEGDCALWLGRIFDICVVVGEGLRVVVGAVLFLVLALGLLLLVELALVLLVFGDAGLAALSVVCAHSGGAEAGYIPCVPYSSSRGNAPCSPSTAESASVGHAAGPGAPTVKDAPQH
jgi:hypothetical protein